METQKIVNFLSSSENEYSKFATKKWYVIDSERNGVYSHQNPIKVLTKSIESSLCDYSNAYILVTGNIAVTRTIAAAGNDPVKRKPLDAATQIVFKNCEPFENCRTKINNTFVDYANFTNIAMPMYNLIEYNHSYSNNSGCLWSFKRDEITDNADMSNENNAPSFKYKSDIIDNTETVGTQNEVKIAVPQK